MAPHINYWAVIVAAIVNMILGFLWYSKSGFGKAWSAMVGVNMEAKPDSGKMAKSMVFMLVGSFLMAWVLDHALIFGNAYLGTGGLVSGIQVGFFNWLGFIAPVTLGVVLWENKPWKLWFINAAYYLVALCLMGMILAKWM